MSFVATAFDAVAQGYDEQPNPVLALEERFLSPMLREVRGRDVLDVGCGTGRWLRTLRALEPRRLTGVDPSQQMLRQARTRLAGAVVLQRGRAEAIPVGNATADVVLSSFALSYGDSLEEIVREFDRVARPDAAIFVSDLHPVTAQQLQWKRTFTADSETVEMRAKTHEWALIDREFARRGWRAAIYLELPFGEEERPIFERSGKLPAFSAAENLPAIYIAEFRRVAAAKCEVSLTGARVTIGATAATPATMTVSGGRVASLQTRPFAAQGTTELDLRGCMILPGLINAHDHLDFALYPNLAHGPYRNSREWAADIHARFSDEITRQSRISKDARIWWGALRNLLSGVTTVCHHNEATAQFDEPEFPVRTAKVAWAHSLAFDKGLAAALAACVPEQPFVLHAAEGFDETSKNEIDALNRMGALNRNSVLVHALACGPDEVDLLNSRGTAVVCCPSSNQLLFGRTISAHLLRRLKRVALGTDSPLTAAGDLLDELRIARSAFHLGADELYAMCTEQSAAILRLADGEGRIGIGSTADLLVIRDKGRAPAESLIDLRAAEIELGLVRGRVCLASERFFQKLPDELRPGLMPLVVDGIRTWVRAPLAWMFAEVEPVLGTQFQLGKRKVRRAG
ncbi:MAG TPA: methyltransferase domain-containing protein [Candidatus Koribacter sp.]|jgi:cytosine/adenosine deaminase-related metal-dependent hydrolase/ubiquinone/menaquinone biosynthesis C-methylase UbiE